MRRPLAALLVLTCALAPIPLWAQEPVLWRELVPGERVRIDAPGVLAGRLATVVVARTRDSITVRAREVLAPAPGEERLTHLTLALDRITRAEVSRGRSHLLGALVGGVAGAAVGLALVNVDEVVHADRTPDVGCDPHCPEETSARYAATTGLVLGSALGFVFARERWRRLEPAPRVSVDPRRREVMVALRRRL